MTPLNEELIERVLARIEADPEAWDQRDFFKAKYSDNNFCGTSACFAGHALLESGWTTKLDVHSPGWVSIRVYDLEGNENGDVEGEAAKLLGFTDREAGDIFFGTGRSTVAEMRKAIDNIRAKRALVNEDVTPG